MTLANESETAAKTRQSVELRQRTRDDQVVILVHQRRNVVGIGGNKAGVRLIHKHHRVVGNILHDTANLFTRQAVASRVVGRCQQQHTRMNAVGVVYHLVNVVGKRVVLLMQRIHLERTATLACHLIIIPPRELRNKNGLVRSLHQEIVDGILQYLLTTVS